jgi:serine/threonine-protein kinase
VSSTRPRQLPSATKWRGDLAKAHAAGIVHRDLKPANIFIAERDDGAWGAKILDFGVSKLGTGRERGAHAREEPAITAVGETLGTPQYMSPEQVEGQADIDGRSDIWSLAATLYEALSGRPAYGARGNLLEVLANIMGYDAAPLSEVAPWVPAALRDAVSAGLVRDRTARTPDAVSFARAMADALPGRRAASTDTHVVTAPSAISCPARARLRSELDLIDPGSNERETLGELAALAAR